MPRDLMWVAATVHGAARRADDLAAAAPPLVDALCRFDPADVAAIVAVLHRHPGGGPR